MHTYCIIGRPLTTTNRQRIVLLPTKRKDQRAPGEEVKYRPSIRKSQLGEQYHKNALFQLRTQRRGRPCIEGPCDIELDIYRAINSGDVDNYAKGILDAIAEAGIVRNDRLFIKCTVEKFTDPKNPRVEIRITEREHVGTLFALDEPDNEVPEFDTTPDIFKLPGE